MKIVARIRQLLAGKEATVVPVVEDVPLPIAVPPEQTLRRVVERPATHRPPQRSPVAIKEEGFLLEGEGIAVPIADPSPDIIRHELERLRTAGPSFVILMAPNGSFLQAAGNAKRMTVEGHSVSAERTTHVVIGRPGSSGPAATVVATFGPIEVQACEVWAAPEVSDLFAWFAQTGSVSPALSRRNISAAIANT